MRHGCDDLFYTLGVASGESNIAKKKREKLLKFSCFLLPKRSPKKRTQKVSKKKGQRKKTKQTAALDQTIFGKSRFRERNRKKKEHQKQTKT